MPTDPAKRIAPTSRGSSAYARKRAVIACQVCRVRRTKCDQKKPRCSFCESIGAECVSDPAALSAFDPASVAIIERLDRLEHEFSRFAHATTTTSTTFTSSEPSRQLGDPKPGNTAFLEHISQRPVEEILQWSVFHKECTPGSTDSPPSVSASCPPRDWPDVSESTSGRLVDDETHSRLLDDFFSHVHTRNPILDESKIRRLSQEVFERGIGWDSESCLCLLVWANGQTGNPLPTVVHSCPHFEQTLAGTLFSAALKRLGLALAHTSILSAQCFFLAGVFLMSALRPFDAWRMFVQALTTCKVVKRTMAHDVDETVVLDRLIWAAWKSERELKRELRVLPREPGSEMPEEFPSPPTTCNDETLQSWYFFLSEIAAWRLEIHVQQESSRLASETNGGLDDFTHTADCLMQQVSEWQDSLASEVSIKNNHKDEDMLRLILKARALYISELISWPFVHVLLHDRVQPMSEPVQKWTVKALEIHLQKINNHRVQFYHRHHGTWLMIRSCARSVCVLIGASKVPFLSPFLEKNWRGVVHDVIQMLRFWQEEVIELAGIVDRIEAIYNEP
ncbi:Zcf27p [Aspergillus melleus]|uniref:Zcf27p n=1 Tax=Aspergillus melleus TaxID=138277 RepID=A0ACC3B980_9EURO|nr:Zcf27p [Aspergillus melleus]